MITRAKSIAFAAAAAVALTAWPAISLAQAASLVPESVTAKTVVYGFGGHCPQIWVGNFGGTTSAGT